MIVTFEPVSLMNSLGPLADLVRPKAKTRSDGILLEFEDGQATFYGSDGEQFVRRLAPVVGVDNPESVIIPSLWFTRLAALSSKSLTLKVKGTELEAASGRSRWSSSTEDVLSIMTMDTTPTSEPTKDVTLPSKILKDMIARSSFCADPETSRTYLNGVWCEFHDGFFVMTSSDTVKVASCSTEMDGGDGQLGIIHVRHANYWTRLLPDTDEPVTLKFGGGIYLSTRDTTVRAPGCVGKIPRWRDMSPLDSEGNGCMILADEFRSFIESCAISAREGLGVTRFTLKDKVLSARTIGSKSGDTSVDVTADPKAAFTAIGRVDQFALLSSKAKSDLFEFWLSPKGNMFIFRDGTYLGISIACNPELLKPEEIP